MQADDTEGVQVALQSILDETAARLLRSKSRDLASLQSPLSIISGVSWLPLANHIFTGLLSFPERLQRLTLRLRYACKTLQPPGDCALGRSSGQSALTSCLVRLHSCSSLSTHPASSHLHCTPQCLFASLCSCTYLGESADNRGSWRGSDCTGCHGFARPVLPLEFPVPPGHRVSVPLGPDHTCASIPRPLYWQAFGQCNFVTQVRRGCEFQLTQ